MIEVQLIYTMEDVEPELFATYTAENADECRDPHLREMVKASLADGEDRQGGVWSTKVVEAA